MGPMVAEKGLKERRASRRMAVHRCGARVRRCLRWVGLGTGPEFRATVVNLSLDGLALRSPQHYRTGECVMVTLYCRGQEGSKRQPITLRGRVVWCSAPGSGTREMVGIQFTGRPAVYRKRGASWVARNKGIVL